MAGSSAYPPIPKDEDRPQAPQYPPALAGSVQPGPAYPWSGWAAQQGPGAAPPPPQYGTPKPWFGAAQGGGAPAPWAGGGPVGSGFTPPDVEAQVLHTFADKQVRRGFMRKVFGIVALQLAITVAFSFACLFVNPIKSYVQSTPWPFFLSWGLSFGLLLVISCNERLRRRWPLNMVMLAAFTLCEAFLVGMITSFFDIEVVLLAFLATCVAVASLAFIACLPGVDVTGWATLLAVPGMVLIALVFIGIFWVNRIFFLVIAGVAALLSAAYLVYDLQLIMGGKTYAISPDEYIFASLSLYMDIVQMFLWILFLLGFARD